MSRTAQNHDQRILVCSSSSNTSILACHVDTFSTFSLSIDPSSTHPRQNQYQPQTPSPPVTCPLQQQQPVTTGRLFQAVHTQRNNDIPRMHFKVLSQVDPTSAKMVPSWVKIVSRLAEKDVDGVTYDMVLIEVGHPTKTPRHRAGRQVHERCAAAQLSTTAFTSIANDSQPCSTPVTLCPSRSKLVPEFSPTVPQPAPTAHTLTDPDPFTSLLDDATLTAFRDILGNIVMCSIGFQMWTTALNKLRESQPDVATEDSQDLSPREV